MPPHLRDLSVYIWRTTAMLFFRGAQSPMHEHVTAQFSLAVGGSSLVRTEDSEWQSAAGVLIPQGLAHGYDATVGGLHLVVWIEPESLAGRVIRARHAGERIHTFTDAQVDDLKCDVERELAGPLGPDGARHIRSRVIEFLTGQQPRPAPPMDPRLERAIAVMYERRAEDLSVSELAERVAMSESSLSHLFRKHIGASVSRYRMWLRALEATRMLPDSPTITDAAHAAGFSDAAHLTRTQAAVRPDSERLSRGQRPSPRHGRRLAASPRIPSRPDHVRPPMWSKCAWEITTASTSSRRTPSAAIFRSRGEGLAPPVLFPVSNRIVRSSVLTR